MINNSQYMKIIQYLSILGGGGLEPPCPPPVPTPMIYNIMFQEMHKYFPKSPIVV